MAVFHLFIYLFIYFRLSDISSSFGLPISKTLSRDDISPDPITGYLPPIPINYDESGNYVTLANLEVSENMKLLPEKDNSGSPITSNGVYSVDFTQHLYKKYKFKVDVPPQISHDPITLIGCKATTSNDPSVSGSERVFSQFTYATINTSVNVPGKGCLVRLVASGLTWTVYFITNSSDSNSSKTVYSGDYYTVLSNLISTSNALSYLHLFYEDSSSSYVWYCTLIESSITDVYSSSCKFNSALVEFDIPV